MNPFHSFHIHCEGKCEPSHSCEGEFNNSFAKSKLSTGNAKIQSAFQWVPVVNTILYSMRKTLSHTAQYEKAAQHMTNLVYIQTAHFSYY